MGEMRCPVPVEARVGANTGEVVVRTIATGAGHTKYTPIEHTTNLASRIQALAPTGSIAVSESTRKLCEGSWVLQLGRLHRLFSIFHTLRFYLSFRSISARRV